MNLSLRQKSASRLAFVQCLYRLKMAQETLSLETLLADVREAVQEGQAGDAELFEGAAPDYAFLKKLLGGCMPELKAYSESVKAHLAADWKLERMNPLLVSILQAALHELKSSPAAKSPVVIDEYTRIARSFFEDEEVNFVHGILHKLAQAA